MESTGGRGRGQPSAEADRAAAFQDDLLQRLADLARQLQHKDDAPAVVDLIVASVVGTIPGAEEATISLVQSRHRVVSAAATSDVARRFDELQDELQQGPVLEAMYERETIRVDDLASDARWPELARRTSAEMGVASVLCFQLFVHDDDLGALTLLARRPGAFTDESERIGLLFASHAAVAVADARDLNHITTALGNRDAIGQAKGVLMERYKISAEMAFALLAKTSHDTNRTLHEVAQHLASTGTLGQ